MPAQRWVLWASGPQRGPAVRFWSLLVCALIFAWGLGSVPLSTLRRWEWALLLVGLTVAGMVRIFWRGLARSAAIASIVATLALVGVTFANPAWLLLGERDRVVGKDQISAAWEVDRSEAGGPSSIEVYIHRLRRKLEGSGLIIRTVRGLGYLLEAESAR